MNETDRNPVEVLAEEFLERHRRGERPSVREYQQRYPGLAAEIDDVFPALMLVEGLKPTSDDSGEPVLPGATADENGDERLGDYRILREIGRGGMGIVYEAVQESLDRHVALKVLPQQTLSDARRKVRFEREARAAAQLHHTNIVPVFGIGHHEGTHYYVMQYIQGMSLAEVLAELKNLKLGKKLERQRAEVVAANMLNQAGEGEQTAVGTVDIPATFGDAAAKNDLSATAEFPALAVPRKEDTATFHLSDTDSLSGSFGPLSHDDSLSGRPRNNYWHSVARIGVQVAEALEYAHEQGIAHRDIKPANLLLDTRGTVWITDFGLAKIGEQDSNVTHSGDVIGTLRYMSPEAFDGQADHRADIYSLGLTLYELLALRPAYDATDRNRLVKQVTSGEPPHLRKLNPDVPRDLETIVHKAIERNPQRRLGTAGELAADLRRFLDDQPIKARRVGWLERGWRWCRRNPGISWTTALAALLIATTITIAFSLIQGEAREMKELAGEMRRLANRNADLLDGEKQAKEQAELALRREAQQHTRAEQQRQKAENERTRAEEQRREAERAAKQAAAVTDFLILDMIGAARPERSQGHEVTVRQMLDRAAQRVGDTLVGDPQRESAVRDAIGRAYYALGLYKKAQAQFSSSLQTRQKVFGSEHLSTLQTTINLAASWYAQGRYKEAQGLLEGAIEVLERGYGKDHPETLAAMGNLAANLERLGHFAEAESLHRHVVEMRTALLGEDNPQTLTTMGNLAVNLSRQQRHDDAGELHQQIVESSRRLLGENHPDTLRALSNMAANLDRQQRYAEAEELHLDVLAKKRKVLGPDHPDTIATINNLAVTLNHQGKVTAAQQLLDELIDTLRRVLGPTHPHTVTAMNSLAHSYFGNGQYAQAEETFAELWALLRGLAGKEHPSTLKTYIRLGESRMEHGKLNEAQMVFRDVLETRRRLNGKHDPLTVSVAHLLATSLLRQDDPGEVGHAEALLDAGPDALPDGHWLAGEHQVLMGRCLATRSEFAEAEQLLVVGYRQMKENAQTPLVRKRRALRQIVGFYERWNKPRLAGQWKAKLDQLRSTPSAQPARRKPAAKPSASYQFGGSTMLPPSQLACEECLQYANPAIGNLRIAEGSRSSAFGWNGGFYATDERSGVSAQCVPRCGQIAFVESPLSVVGWCRQDERFSNLR